MRFFSLLVLVPLTEFYLLFTVAKYIGFLPTLCMVLLTAAIGLHCLRQQGFDTLWRGQQKLQSGQVPAQEMTEGLVLAFCGALLITPGILTDIVGFSGLVPAIRKRIAKKVLNKAVASGAVYQQGHFQQRPHSPNHSEGETVQGEFWEASSSETDDDKPKLK